MEKGLSLYFSLSKSCRLSHLQSARIKCSATVYVCYMYVFAGLGGRFTNDRTITSSKVMSNKNYA